MLSKAYMTRNRIKQKKDIKIIYDGVCNLCNGLVRFLKHHDPQNRFMFIPSQSNTGHRLIHEYSLGVNPDFIIVIKNNKVFTRSSAVLKIIESMNFPWKIIYVTRFLPRSVRDYLYGIVARNRHKWFGTLKTGDSSMNKNIKTI